MMPADTGDALLKVGRVAQFLPKDEGRDKIFQHMPGRAGCLIAVARITPGDTFAIALHSVCVAEPQQYPVTLGHAPKRGLKRRHQRQTEMKDGNGFNFHATYHFLCLGSLPARELSRHAETMEPCDIAHCFGGFFTKIIWSHKTE